MKEKDKRALLRDMQGLFQGANMQNAQVNMFVERGAKVVYKEVVTNCHDGGSGRAAAGGCDAAGGQVSDDCAGGDGADGRHFPLTGREDEGRQWYAFLLEHGFIGDETSLAEWLFLMGFTTACPDEVKPIVWLKTVETARVMLRRLFAPLIDGRRLTVARMGELASQCFTKQGVPLRLAKAKKEYSQDVAAIEDFLPTVPDL